MKKFISVPDNSRHNTERWASRVLRLGVWISASLMILGLLISAIYPFTITAPSANPSLGELLKHAFSGTLDPVTLMFTGLVLLMFTPIIRVITAVFGFTVERDWRFVFVSCTVLFMLIAEIVYSIFLKG